jgi:GNAT superfamily N-acetyltransferase
MARELHGVEAGVDLAVMRPRFDALLADADVTPFMAEIGTQAVGIGVLHFRRRLNFTTFEGWISELFVAPAARGQGIGRALLEALVAEWRLRGGHRLQLQVPAQAPAAEALLSRAGFEPWMLDFVQRPVVAARADLPPSVNLRPARLADGDAITSLLSEFGAQRTPPAERMDAVLRIFTEQLRRVDAGGGRTVVAELDGAVVGACSVEWRDPFWIDERHAWLPDLMVTERARGRGIGRALLADAVAAAAAQTATQLTLESGLARTAAHGLYRSTGFAEAGRTYRLLRGEQ